MGRTSSDIGTGHQLICRVFPEPILQDRTVEACTRRLGPQGAEAGVCLPVSGPEGRLEAGGKSVGKERGMNARGAQGTAELRERPETSAAPDTTLPDWEQETGVR